MITCRRFSFRCFLIVLGNQQAWRNTLFRNLDIGLDGSAETLALDSGGNLSYLAPTLVNLNLAQERWPEVRFTAPREH